ncbi:hypothetical protein D9M73_235360 [compost metagenome]
MANTNSPNRKENDSSRAIIRPLRRFGSTTRKAACQVLAPSNWAASIRSRRLIACRLLVMARYMKGRAMVKKQPIRIQGVPTMASGPEP